MFCILTVLAPAQHHATGTMYDPDCIGAHTVHYDARPFRSCEFSEECEKIVHVLCCILTSVYGEWCFRKVNISYFEIVAAVGHAFDSLLTNEGTEHNDKHNLRQSTRNSSYFWHYYNMYRGTLGIRHNKIEKDATGKIKPAIVVRQEPTH